MGKRVTNEEFLRRINESNKFIINKQVEVLEEYKGTHEQLACKCIKHNEIFYLSPHRLYDGYGCPKCSHEKIIKSKTVTNEMFLQRMGERNTAYQNGNLEILEDYNGADVRIKCRCVIHNHIFYPTPSNLYNNHGCPKCGYETVTKKMSSTRDMFIEKLREVSPNITVIGDYKNNKTKITMQCEKGHVWDARPDITLSEGRGCPYCSGNKVWPGYNDINTTAPEIAKLLKNKEDGLKYSKWSGEKIDFICPDCNSIVNARISDVSHDGFSCCFCSDGISYPNKFIREMVRQLPVETYQHEWNPDWIKPLRYDLYFKYKGKDVILEANGPHHYREIGSFGRSLEEVQKIDKIKIDAAVEHGIKIIHIDCSKSKCEFIKNNILSSELSNVIDLSGVDWQKCDNVAQKNLVRSVCDMYDPESHNIKELMNIFELSNSTVYVYLRRGAELGWCNYVRSTTNRLPVSTVLIDNNDNIIMSFKTLHECETIMKEKYNVKIDRHSVKRACEIGKPYNGFNFRFLESTIQN